MSGLSIAWASPEYREACIKWQVQRAGEIIDSPDYKPPSSGTHDEWRELNVPAEQKAVS